MSTITININDISAENSVKSFLDKMGLKYNIETPTHWWEDKDLIEELDKRSAELKSGADKGFSFAQIKDSLLKPKG